MSPITRLRGACPVVLIVLGLSAACTGSPVTETPELGTPAPEAAVDALRCELVAVEGDPLPPIGARENAVRRVPIEHLKEALGPETSTVALLLSPQLVAGPVEPDLISVLQEALRYGLEHEHFIFAVSAGADDIARAAGLYDVPTPWDPIGSYLPSDAPGVRALGGVGLIFDRHLPEDEYIRGWYRYQLHGDSSFAAGFVANSCRPHAQQRGAKGSSSLQPAPDSL